MPSTTSQRITSISRDELREFAVQRGEKAFRGDQVWQWIFEKGVFLPSQMSNLSKPFRQALSEAFDCSEPRVEWKLDPSTFTDKLFLKLPDGDGVEAVLINEGPRTTVCLSSQVGCPVACTFCASGALGLRRNLSKGEILDQFLMLRRRSLELGRRISNVVMMGMGEPLLNYEAVVSAMDVLNDPKGGAIGARHLTVSTIGLGKGLERLKASKRQYTVAFSLHAPNDTLRRELIPFPAAMSIDELVQAAKDYLKDTGREVTFEYVMLDGVNSSPSHARTLAQLLRGVRGTVNLIPYNENPGLPYKRPHPDTVDEFAEILRNARVKTSVRKRKGNNILAACGQLRLRELKAGNTPPPSGEL